MPFNFGGGADMYGNTVTATDGLKNKLKSVFGWTEAQAYVHVGISGMNGQQRHRRGHHSPDLDPDPRLVQLP